MGIFNRHPPHPLLGRLDVFRGRVDAQPVATAEQPLDGVEEHARFLRVDLVVALVLVLVREVREQRP